MAKSSREPYRAQIEEGLRQQLLVQRVKHDLVAKHQFAGSYHAVRRFARKIGGSVGTALSPDRMRGEEEAQVDSGQGASW